MFSGFQPGLVEARQRPRLLSESDPGLELPQLGSGNNVLYLLHFPEMNYFLAMKYFLCLGCQADWAQLPRAMSPDGESIVTSAEDEILRLLKNFRKPSFSVFVILSSTAYFYRFWDVFSKARSQKKSKSALNL